VFIHGWTGAAEAKFPKPQVKAADNASAFKDERIIGKLPPGRGFVSGIETYKVVAKEKARP
jgi:hypothetical protein